jgi:hypothetical protein
MITTTQILSWLILFLIIVIICLVFIVIQLLEALSQKSIRSNKHIKTIL